MTEASTIPMPLLVALAAGGDVGNKVADVICRLVADGAALGELGEVTIDGETGPRTVKVLPQQWLTRLNLAVERGAMGRMSVDRIVERLLTPSEAA